MSTNAGAPDKGAPTAPHERITGAELRVWGAWLGLPPRPMSELLRVRWDTAKRWVAGRDPIPIRVGEELEAIEAYTARAVGDVVSALQDSPDPAVLIYRSDEEMWAERPEFRPYPASWWLMVVARATAEVPGVEIEYAHAKYRSRQGQS